jgi:hypothetical protein
VELVVNIVDLNSVKLGSCMMVTVEVKGILMQMELVVVDVLVLVNFVVQENVELRMEKIYDL